MRFTDFHHRPSSWRMWSLPYFIEWTDSFTHTCMHTCTIVAAWPRIKQASYIPIQLPEWVPDSTREGCQVCCLRVISNRLCTSYFCMYVYESVGTSKILEMGGLQVNREIYVLIFVQRVIWVLSYDWWWWQWSWRRWKALAFLEEMQ